MPKPLINVVGAGLAGCEAAWQAAKTGCAVRLYEMRPQKMTAAHHGGMFAELVCSNSLKSDALDNACGLLKAEMREFGSLILESAAENRVPAGAALAVDREGFAGYITAKLKAHSDIEIVEGEVEALDSLDGITVIASGPLTSDRLARNIAGLCGEEFLYFYDAAAPLLEKDSIDMNIAFAASRYGKGDPDYLNLPLNEEQYTVFRNALVAAEKAELKSFENLKLFEGCMPIEEMAARGVDTMRFGPLKPVGLPDPRSGEEVWAVVQLRQDNFAASLYNMVGFQTNLKWPEQKRVFSLLPGLENAEFVRYGVMHRNTYINSPQLLTAALQFKNRAELFFAGQVTGMEGYVESAAGGMVAGINAARLARGMETVVFPAETMTGALCRYISSPQKHFQPMNANFGIIPPTEKKIRNKKERYQYYAQRALDRIAVFRQECYE